MLLHRFKLCTSFVAIFVFLDKFLFFYLDHQSEQISVYVTLLWPSTVTVWTMKHCRNLTVNEEMWVCKLCTKLKSYPFSHFSISTSSVPFLSSSPCFLAPPTWDTSEGTQGGVIMREESRQHHLTKEVSQPVLAVKYDVAQIHCVFSLLLKHTTVLSTHDIAWNPVHNIGCHDINIQGKCQGCS